MPTGKTFYKMRVRDFSFSSSGIWLYFIHFDKTKNINVFTSKYNTVFKCSMKGILLNTDFRLNSFAKKGMMFVSEVQHFTLININKMVVTLIGEHFFLFLIFFALLCFALFCFTPLCCIITKVFFSFHTEPFDFWSIRHTTLITQCLVR